MVKSSFSSLSLLHSGSASSEDLSTCSSPSTLSETSTEESLPHSGQALELELDSGSTQLTVSFKEKNVLAWMRAHPNEPFTVDAECNISPLSQSTVAPEKAFAATVARQNPVREDSYETVDLTNEPPVEEETYRPRNRKGIAPGSFSAVGGSQRIMYKRKGDRSPAQTTASSIRQGQHGTRGLRAASVKLTSQQGQGQGIGMRVAGASVLQGASNFIINGASIAPGAFSAVAGNQEIWC